MMSTLAVALLLAGGVVETPVTVTASLPAKTLEVGGTYEIELTVAVADGWSASDAGLPNPILQIDVPACAKLDGKVLMTQRELGRNEFLLAPFERLVEPGSTTITFTLTGEPGANDRFGLNVVSYLRNETTKAGLFDRQRLELPVATGAKATPGDATNSHWGDTRRGLQIGDKAKGFTLPKADGTTVSLDDYLGRTNIIVTTYRAFW